MVSLPAPFACDSCTKCILFKRLCENLQRFADYDFISLENIDHAIILKFDRPERVAIMQQLEDIKRAVLIPFKGWRLELAPAHADDNADPITAEFGHACHGCARYPCDKSMVGEPADCWEYVKKEGV